MTVIISDGFCSWKYYFSFKTSKSINDLAHTIIMHQDATMLGRHLLSINKVKVKQEKKESKA